MTLDLEKFRTNLKIVAECIKILTESSIAFICVCALIYTTVYQFPEKADAFRREIKEDRREALDMLDRVGKRVELIEEHLRIPVD